MVNEGNHCIFIERRKQNAKGDILVNKNNKENKITIGLKMKIETRHSYFFPRFFSYRNDTIRGEKRSKPFSYVLVFLVRKNNTRILRQTISN